MSKESCTNGFTMKISEPLISLVPLHSYEIVGGLSGHILSFSSCVMKVQTLDLT